ncbi:zinc finger MYM-type protein 1-like [Photinus pyralis]|nr:zinc finger MYM-type protein 1-like [Photinus pyralis]XP_031338132.1 zinc finger MYM-type protein 1-like [Photinus pyralis]XP_031346007.1 zinc finger MYM-type protein 1-like [Photinus pyralis]
MLKMKRKFESGAEKRKKLKAKQQCAEKLRGSLSNFLISDTDTACSSSSSMLPVTRECEINVNDTVEATSECLTVSSEASVQEFPLQRNDVPVPSVETQSSSCVNFPLDIALWPSHISDDKIIDYLIDNKPQNIGDVGLLKSEFVDRNRKYSRSFCTSNFYTTKANGTKEFREWLRFSTTSKCVYCYVCKLFSHSENKLKDGYNDWRNVNKALKEHESSLDHVRSILAFKRRSSALGRVDSNMVKQLEEQQQYWREVLKRIIATVKLLSTLGLAFRGHRETNEDRKGNFLTCIDYLAEFDPFLKAHLQKYSNPGSGHVNYLSHAVCDEFINIMGSEVKQKLISDVKNATYFAIIVDSTPDITHTDQLTLILRFVDEKGKIRERFFGFLEIEQHDSSYLENVILSALSSLTLSITQCRGQSYDNAANMSGKYSGLQTRIKSHCPSAVFVPCASHSLNLVGNAAAESCPKAVQYFAFVQNVYTFFASSTRRWNELLNCLNNQNNGSRSIHLKRLSDTRWSARADAVSALRFGYKSIKEVLFRFSESAKEKAVTRLEAKTLYKNFDNYEYALMTILWDQLLSRINSTSKSLQKEDINILQGAKLLKSLSNYILDIRTCGFEDIEQCADLLTENHVFPDEDTDRRVKKRKLQFDESRTNDTCLVGRQGFIVTVHNVVCDVLIAEINRRSTAYNEVLADFSVFFEQNMDKEDFETRVRNLMTRYSEDIDVENFKEELKQFLKYTWEEKITDPRLMYEAIVDGLKSTFPNVETILKIFLTIPICNATGERSFSTLKRVKNYLRNSLSQQHLSSLSLMFIENDVVQNLDYNNIIDKFAREKARKVSL